MSDLSGGVGGATNVGQSAPPARDEAAVQTRRDNRMIEAHENHARAAMRQAEVAENIAEQLYRLALRTGYRSNVNYTAEQINGTVIGHLLVGWAMLIAVIAFFNMPGLREYASFSIALSAMALLMGWLAMSPLPPRAKFSLMVGSATATVMAWCWLLALALRAI
jgi:hypothetical protein